MHPRMFLDSFWRNDLRDEVFVAMSFDEKFDHRWAQIFTPAIESDPLLGRSLKAVRVDIRRSGDSILTEITSGIAHAQLVLADISVTDEWEDGDKSRWYRNGNVMYEVGLALACRQPVEVILVRDDSRSLLFDLSHIPVVPFNPDDIDGSVATIRSALKDRLSERDLAKDIRFTATLESLAQFEINLIRQNAHLPVLRWEGPSYPPAVGIALPRVLDKGILRLVKPASGGRPDIYTWTTFGRAIADRLVAAGEKAT
jgi:hypothetical protein